jgi:H+/Cl- antiporter ClcA
VARPTEPAIWQIVLIALVAIAVTALFLSINGLLNNVIWDNSFVSAHRWTIPVGAVVFSALVGIIRKYLHAPSVIHGGAMESLKGSGDEHIDPGVFPGTLLSSLCSLLSGACVGPEGPVGFLVQQVAAWLHQRLRLAKSSWQGFEASAFASAYNGIIGNPLFTGVLATEYKVGGQSGLVYLAWNLLAGVIGYLFYVMLGLNSFAQYVTLTPPHRITLTYVIFAILLALVGCLLALLVGLAFQVIGQAMDRIFGNAVILRVLAAGVVIGVVGYFVPEVLFAGESQIFPILHNPASYGALALFGLGLLKLLLLALSFKSGYLGGPTFPVLFGCTMFGLAFSLLFPTVPVSILVLCIEVSALTLASGAPLTMILLVAVVGTADVFTLALLALSASVAVLVGEGIKRLRAQRAAAPAARARPAR